MPQFNNLKELESYLKDKVQNAMINEVAAEVIRTEKRHIQTDVYNAYPNPTEYNRTYQLIADESFRVKEIEDEITIKNIRHDEETGKMIAPVIESGFGYDYPFEFYGVKRPFTENTIIELQDTKNHVKALKKGLDRQGIEVE